MALTDNPFTYGTQDWYAAREFLKGKSREEVYRALFPMVGKQKPFIISDNINGTRKAKPSSFPFISGITSPTARAAPVEVGMMFAAAERARRRSEWGASRMRWSLV